MRATPAVLGLVVAAGACTPTARPHDGPESPAAPAAPSDVATAGEPAPRTASVAPGAEAQAAEGGDGLVEASLDDAMGLRRETAEALAQLAWTSPPDAGDDGPPSPFQWMIGPIPGRFNQGNPAESHHAVTRSACLAGLRGVVLQTDEQRKRCKGMENMVPIYSGGDPASAHTCIDVFEFPNKACELPFVWGTPSEAERICELSGKRLCSQGEWNLACRGDPEGKPDRVYAYGDDLDLSICNTNKPHPMGPTGQWLCNPYTAQTTWATCTTETEPSGAFPGCRSRFGVYDQHGNVAEMMTRTEGGVLYTQLKGSAFFYVDVSRKPAEAQKPGERETYPDHCNYDPRWHVEVLSSALHSNYHLGFRCCVSI